MNAKPGITAIALGLICLFVSGISASPAPNVYAVVLETFDSIGAAEDQHMALTSLGYDPLELNVMEDGAELILGEYPYYADAYVHTQALKAQGFKNASIKSRQNLEGKVSFSAIENPACRPVFQMVDGAPGTEPAVLAMDEPRVAQAQQWINTLETEQAFERIMEASTKMDNDDPVKGWMNLKLAYLSYRKADKATARQLFQRVAEGRVACPPEQRAEAMRRVAGIIHSQGDRLEAYKAYKELYEAAPTEELKVESALQLCGLIMELAKDEEIGSLEDSRAFFDEVLNWVPEDYFDIKARIKLMNAETYYYQNDFEKAIEEGNRFLAEYTDKPYRERAMMMVFVGLAYNEMGDYETCQDTLADVLDLPLGPNDGWAAIPDMKEHALEWLIATADRRGDVASVNMWTAERDRMGGEPK